MITDREMFETISKRLAASPHHKLTCVANNALLQRCVNLCMRNLLAGRPYEEYSELERLGILALMSVYGHDALREKLGL